MSAATPQSPGSGAAVLGMGASSPIGYGVRPIQAAMAGGLRNFRSATVLDGHGEPARISRLPDVEESVPRAGRLEALTRLAVADLLDSMTALDLPGGVPIFVGVAHDEPESDLEAVGRALAEQSGGLFSPEAATVFVGYRGGRIAFLSALAKAIRSFDEGTIELALIVGVDTRCTGEAVEARIRERRLLTARDDGTIPGEAAVIALVAAPLSRFAIQHARFLVCDPAFAQDEFETIRQSPQAANGLGRAFRAIREHPVAGAIRAGTVIAFETGEICFSRAFVTGYLRNAELMPEPLQHELIATHVGDAGAAAAGMALVRADGLLQREDGGGNARVLIYGHADNGRCAATMVIRR